MSALPVLHVGVPAQLGPVSLFPVWTSAPLHARRGYISTRAIDEELDDSEVSALLVHSPRHRPLLLCEGTVLEGGWQHRAVATRVVVAPRETLQVPVLCVEQGRWGGPSAQSGGRRRVPAATRGAIRGCPAASWSRSTSGAASSDVWASVERAQERFVPSATSSLLDVQRAVEPSLTAAVRAVALALARRGVVVGVGGHVVTAEVFDHPQMFATHWRSIVAAAVMHGVGQSAVATDAWRARSFVRHAVAAASGQEDQYVDATALCRGGELVHLVAVSRTHHLVLAA